MPRVTSRFLEWALLLTIAAHLAAMILMALLLLPGIPGGSGGGVAERAAYLADHPWLWRIGWFPWQLTAASDVLLALALVRTRWAPKLPAVLALVPTLVAVALEQPNEFRWMTTGVDLAKSAVASGSYEEFLAFETITYRYVSLWAALFYIMAAIGWSFTLAAAGVWRRALTWLSVAAWSILLLVSGGPLVLGMDHIPPAAIAAGNAIGFILLMIWFVLVTEEVLRRSRPAKAHGRYSPWRYPRRGVIGDVADAAANSHLLRAVGELLPSPTLVSDITNVIYVNYLADAEGLAPLVPPGLELQRLGPDGRYALFSVLTYRHGHFGPRMLGPLRRLLPSPTQSNWRIHVRDPRTGIEGIYFVKTAISSFPHALAARHLSEGVSMHVPKALEVEARGDGGFRIRIDPGEGSAPDIEAELRPVDKPAWPAPWSECFADFREFLAYCVPQDRAMSSQPWRGRITRQEIQLNIPLDDCRPLAGSVASQTAAGLVGYTAPVCFLVPRVAFRYEGEEYDSDTTPQSEREGADSIVNAPQVLDEVMK
jgi:hypothetical protein